MTTSTPDAAEPADIADFADAGPESEGVEQLSPEDTLDTQDVDQLDTSWSPPDTARGSVAFGTTAWEQTQEESIDQRILQEVPDPTSAYGAPFNESGLDVPRVGGDDPDAIDAEDDWVGDAEVGGHRAGRLMAPDQGAHSDTDAELIGTDVGIDGGAASAEEAAMHVIGEDEGDDDLDLDIADPSATPTD